MSKGRGPAWVISKCSGIASARRPHQLVDRDPLAAADVEGAGHAAGRRRLEVRLHHVVDVDEIAGLLAVAEDRDGATLEDLRDEHRDDAAIGVVPLVRPVDIEVAEADQFDAMEAGIGEAHLLGGELGDAMGRARCCRLVLVHRQRLEFPEDRRRRGQDDLLDPREPRRFEQADGADEVGLRIGDEVVHAPPAADRRGEVEDRPAALDRALDGGRIADVAVDQPDVEAGKIGAVAGREVVEHRHRPPLRHQASAEVRSDEPGTAGHQGSHVPLPCIISGRPAVKQE